MQLKVIAGLGNPGAEYAETPHNVGFRVVDAIAADSAAQWRAEAKFAGLVARAKSGALDLMLLKPTTYMNLSGEAVGRLMRYFNVELGDLTVVSDDADLPIGRLRVRADGSAGGHRGLQSIIDCMGGGAFARVRVGVGRPERREGGLVGYVLGRLEPEAEKVLREVEAEAAKAALCVARRGVDAAMNSFNRFNLTITNNADGGEAAEGTARDAVVAPQAQGTGLDPK